MIDLDKIRQRIQKGEEIEKIIEEIDWKEFEELVMKILEEHDFHSSHNFRFKFSRAYEIDVLAIRNDLILGIDCKHWDRGRYKKSSLKYAVIEQKNRLKKLKKFIKNNPIIKNKFKITEKTRFTPLLITWFEETLIEHEKVFIVPIWKLNQFLLNLSDYV